MSELFRDIPTNHRVIRRGKKRKVFKRFDFNGEFVRYVTRVSKREQENIRKKEYRGASVGIASWTEVQPWEIGK